MDAYDAEEQLTNIGSSPDRLVEFRHAMTHESRRASFRIVRHSSA